MMVGKMRSLIVSAKPGVAQVNHRPMQGGGGGIRYMCAGTQIQEFIYHFPSFEFPLFKFIQCTYHKIYQTVGPN